MACSYFLTNHYTLHTRPAEYHPLDRNPLDGPRELPMPWVRMLARGHNGCIQRISYWDTNVTYPSSTPPPLSHFQPATAHYHCPLLPLC